MSQLQLEISATAANDVLEQADWYTTRAEERLAERWESAVTATVLRIIDYPYTAAICRFKNPELSEIRRIPVKDFPRHLIFYRVTKTKILILRLLHGARDLEVLFSS